VPRHTHGRGGCLWIERRRDHTHAGCAVVDVDDGADDHDSTRVELGDDHAGQLGDDNGGDEGAVVGARSTGAEGTHGGDRDDRGSHAGGSAGIHDANHPGHAGNGANDHDRADASRRGVLIDGDDGSTARRRRIRQMTWIETIDGRTLLRRLAPLVCAAALAVGASACGSDGGTTHTKDAPTSTTPSTTAPESGGAGF
jgi:hypothetical protein